eukprot:11038222-Alexandrium_andersonii.AAC.1
MKRRDRIVDLLLEALGLGPSLADAELFAICQERGGPCSFLASGASRKEEKRDADLALLQGVCAQRGIPADTFQPAPRERS